MVRKTNGKNGYVPKFTRPGAIKLLHGQRFGKLTVVRMLGRRDSGGAVMWTCKCDCGNTTQVRGSNLKTGNVRSCGCLRKGLKGERRREARLKFASAAPATARIAPIMHRTEHVGTCGACNGCALVYDPPRPNGPALEYPFTCSACGATGSEWYSVEYVYTETVKK